MVFCYSRLFIEIEEYAEYLRRIFMSLNNKGTLVVV